jgi:hypothetical protein
MVRLVFDNAKLYNRHEEGQPGTVYDAAARLGERFDEEFAASMRIIKTATATATATASATAPTPAMALAKASGRVQYSKRVEHMDRDCWRNWLMSINIREELADKYAKVLVDNEVDEVHVLETLTEQQLQELGMKVGSAAKIRRHFNVSASPRVRRGINVRNASCSRSGRNNTIRSGNTGVTLNYQWEWQRQDGKLHF